MSRREEYEQKAEELITPIVEANGFELVDVEYVKEGGTWYLRAYIDKEGGITVDDCEIVSRAFSDRLDAEDFIDDAYHGGQLSGSWTSAEKREGLQEKHGKRTGNPDIPCDREKPGILRNTHRI